MGSAPPAITFGSANLAATRPPLRPSLAHALDALPLRPKICHLANQIDRCSASQRPCMACRYHSAHRPALAPTSAICGEGVGCLTLHLGAPSHLPQALENHAKGHSDYKCNHPRRKGRKVLECWPWAQAHQAPTHTE